MFFLIFNMRFFSSKVQIVTYNKEKLYYLEEQRLLNLWKMRRD